MSEVNPSSSFICLAGILEDTNLGLCRRATPVLKVIRSSSQPHPFFFFNLTKGYHPRNADLQKLARIFQRSSVYICTSMGAYRLDMIGVSGVQAVSTQPKR